MCYISLSSKDDHDYHCEKFPSSDSSEFIPASEIEDSEYVDINAVLIDILPFKIYFNDYFIKWLIWNKLKSNFTYWTISVEIANNIISFYFLIHVPKYTPMEYRILWYKTLPSKMPYL